MHTGIGVCNASNGRVCRQDLSAACMQYVMVAIMKDRHILVSIYSNENGWQKIVLLHKMARLRYVN